MKKLISVLLVIMLVASIFVLTGCEKKNEDTEEIVAMEEKVPTVIDRTNSKMKTEEEVVDQIKVSTQKYFEMVYGEKLEDTNYYNIVVYKGDEELMKYVDLDVDDYAFEIDYDLKITDEKDAKDLETYTGKYNEETGWIKECHGYGVMRYNTISGDYDVTSITANEF